MLVLRSLARFIKLIMDKVLKPKRLDVEPGTVNASAKYKHWHKTFTNYLSASTHILLNQSILFISPR